MKEKIICLAEHGIAPGTRADTAAAFQKFMEGLERQEDGDSLVLQFTPGVYHFYEEGAVSREYYVSNHTQTGQKKCAMLLEDRSRITIDGNGSKFILHGTLIPVALVDTESCGLKNCSIDYEYPVNHQFTVLECEEEQNTLTCRIDSDEPYRIEDGNRLVFTAENNAEPEVASIMPFEDNGCLCYNKADLCFDPEQIEQVSEHVIRICGWRSDFAPGCHLVLRVKGRPTPGIFLYRARNTEIDDVAVHFTYGMGLLAQLSENILIDHFRISRRGADDIRRFTTHADATHFSGCKGRVVVQNSLFEAMADDAINVHGTYLKIQEKTDRRTVRASYMHRECWGMEWGQAGDVVQFVNPSTMECVDLECRIASISPVDAPTPVGAKTFEVVFEADLSDDIPFADGYGMENMNWTPEVVFRNNTVRNNRARGALFSTPRKVVCEENLFDHVHGAAVLLCGDCNGWFETGACRDVLIRKNRIINPLTAMYQFTTAAISIYPEIPDLPSQEKYFHSGIVISENDFELFDAPVLYAKSVKGLVFEQNRIRYNHDFDPFHENTHTFLFEHAADVTITGNDFGREFDFDNDLCVRYGAIDEIALEL